MIVPAHAGGLEMTGPVGVIGFPQPSFTDGGEGTTISLRHATEAFVGDIGTRGG